MKLYKTTIFFKIERVTKKNWEDATCDNCSREFYPKEKYVYLWEGKYKGYLLLCESCMISEKLLDSLKEDGGDYEK